MDEHDEHHEHHDDQADQTDQAEIRALLADLAGPAMPAAVAARLDGVLADLAAEQGDLVGQAAPAAPEPGAGDRPADTDVVPLAARRSRRRWGGVLVAATVAAVVGLGLTQVIGDDPSAETSSAGVAADVAPQELAAPEASSDDPGQGDDSAAPADRVPVTTAGAVPGLRTDSFAVAAPARIATLEAARDTASEEFRAAQRDSTALSGRACTPRLADGDRAWRIRLDGRPGVLVVRRVGTRGAGPEQRLAEAWRCRDLAADPVAAPRATTVVPAP